MTQLVGYHASTRRIETITAFRDPRGMDYGPGFYLATDPHDTTSYGSWVHRAEVRLDKPVVFSASSVDMTLVKKLQRAFDIEDGFLSGPYPLVDLMGLINTVIEMGLYTPTQLKKYLMKLGYDGVYVENGILAAASRAVGTKPPRGDFFAIFEPSQILSWTALDVNYQRLAQNRRRSSRRRTSRRSR